jgi:transposase
MLKCSVALQPLYDRLHTILLEQSVIQADETTLNVIKEARSSCYMWLYCTGKDGPDKQSPIPNIVLYDFQPTRSAQCAIDFLQGFDGYLNVDGYQAYESTHATLAGTHVENLLKRKKACPKANRAKRRWRSTTSNKCTPSKS